MQQHDSRAHSDHKAPVHDPLQTLAMVGILGVLAASAVGTDIVGWKNTLKHVKGRFARHLPPPKIDAIDRTPPVNRQFHLVRQGDPRLGCSGQDAGGSTSPGRTPGPAVNRTRKGANQAFAFGLNNPAIGPGDRGSLTSACHRLAGHGFPGSHRPKHDPTMERLQFSYPTDQPRWYCRCGRGHRSKQTDQVSLKKLM